ncbi:MAG: hypothetical protein ACLQAN_03165 [Acidimicrobiales bacterium]
MRVLVDFNEVYEGNLVWAIRRQTTVTQDEQPLSVGDWVELYDYDSTSCLGRVTAVTDQTIDCEIDLDTIEYARSDISLFQGVYESVGYFTPGQISQVA